MAGGRESGASRAPREADPAIDSQGRREAGCKLPSAAASAVPAPAASRGPERGRLAPRSGANAGKLRLSFPSFSTRS
ncbi:hypothetical protein BGLA2_430043 [Burkholderia gladioli]|nr:hypothetical protein BGLA2_430043 [Burkholderia gladioli]